MALRTVGFITGSRDKSSRPGKPPSSVYAREAALFAKGQLGAPTDAPLNRRRRTSDFLIEPTVRSKLVSRQDLIIGRQIREHCCACRCMKGLKP